MLVSQFNSIPRKTNLERFNTPSKKIVDTNSFYSNYVATVDNYKGRRKCIFSQLISSAAEENGGMDET